jgi:peptidoglycan/xylan/chitin deacetylase (PgdA/CDA1 family)
MARYRRAAALLRRAGLEKPIHSLLGAGYAVDTAEPVFHLTFDDGPHPDVTPAVLDALDDFDAKATFFVLTSLAEQHPDIVHTTLSRGHVVALHTRTHRRLSTLTWSQLVDEIRGAKRDLEAVTGASITWFRPPYGSEGLRSIPVIRASGLRTLMWSADTHDWKGVEPDRPLKNVLKNLAPGGIALLHDVPVGNTVTEDDARGLLRKEELTRVLLKELTARALRPVGLDTLLRSGPVLRRAKLA